MLSIVLILCVLSASFIIIILTSFVILIKIFLRFAFLSSSFVSKLSLLILVTPSTNVATSLLNSFLIHPKFLEELRTLLKTDLKGKESIFFKILTTQLSNIKNFGSKIYTIDSNEILQGADGHYYSIHLQKSQFNVRLIVYINDENIPYFLCAFNERSGKNRTNY